MTNWCDILGWGPQHLQELRFSAYLYFKEGMYDTAKVFFEALIILDPESVYDKRMLGATYILLGDYQKAIVTLDEALKIDPTHLGAKMNRTKALLFLGMIKEGLEAAEPLTHCDDAEIANDAQALLLAYK